MSLDRSTVVQPRLPAAELSSQAEQLGKHFEIIHSPQTDVIINHDAGLVGHASALQKLFEGGIPYGWKELEFTGSDNVNIFTSTLDGQSFVAKRRYHADGSADVAAIKQRKAEGTTANRQIYALNSVLSEVALAPKVKRLLQSREAEEIVSGFGFARVEYVEPIIAYIVRGTGEKGAVYEKVEESDWRFDRFSVGDFNVTVDRLKELLRKFGIRPMDFKLKHLLLDEQDGLHLIDTEMFYAARR